MDAEIAAVVTRVIRLPPAAQASRRPGLHCSIDAQAAALQGVGMTPCLCPICETGCDGFGVEPGTRTPGRCPTCRSLARSRLLWLYYRDASDVLDRRLRVLHFAPERSLQPRFESIQGWEYVTADLLRPGVSVHMDVTDNLFRDGVFDLIMFNHVLEHVHDDQAALRQNFRVLKSGGWMMLTVPLDKSARRTVYCPQRDDRPLAEYLPGDHVRDYGWDLVELLESVGFAVAADAYSKRLAAPDVARYGVKNDILFICRKP